MNILFFDTSFDFILVSLFKVFHSSVNEIYSFKENCPRESSFRLIKEIRTSLEKSNIEKPNILSCSVGPGSFTGIRISVSTCRNLSQLWNIPFHKVDTLELYQDYYETKFNKSSIIYLDGKQNKVYKKEKKESSIEIVKTEMKFSKEDLIVSDMNLDLEFISIYEDIPSPKAYFEKNFRNLKLESDYEKLTPNYMRESYAKK